MSLPVKIGNYRFERNLGNGTFGKVKCKHYKLIIIASNQAKLLF